MILRSEFLKEAMEEFPTAKEIVQEMRRWGIRVTAQRLAVAEVLVRSKDHPTAQEVYERVQARFPHITMGTVYNTMNTLAKRGFIQPLPFRNGARYDGNPLPHANLVCIQCDSITDVQDDEEALNRLRERAIRSNRFQVISQRLDLYGVCARCAEQ